jgi:hypothetical protein
MEIKDAKELYYNTKLKLKDSRHDIEHNKIIFEHRKDFIKNKRYNLYFLRAIIVIIGL